MVRQVGGQRCMRSGALLTESSCWIPQQIYALVVWAQGLYNCADISSATFNVLDPATNLTTNQRPFCAELYNPRCVAAGMLAMPAGLGPSSPGLR